ncbi:MAG: hypothetical protein IPN31_16430 [Bacteroidetes bacterium]|nr:hypothetical protein [Bacteroidota bacterium]
MDDWNKVPIIEKEHIRNNSEQIIVTLLPRTRLLKSTTGGSTGEPLVVYRDRHFPEEILKWRMLKHWELNPGVNMGMIWRIPNSNKTFKYRTINNVIWWPTKRVKLDASFITEEKLWAFYNDSKKYSIEILQGYVGGLEQFTNFVLKHKLKLPSVKLVWGTAAPISTLQKTLFSEAFTSNILDQYACSEIHFVAANCPGENNLHVNIDYRHIDIINSETQRVCSNYEYGDILLTDLQNEIFPLIKYRVGDRAKWENSSCTCGCVLPLISPVKGRISDYLEVPGYGVLNGEFLTTVFDPYYLIVKQFQFIQSKDMSIKISLVPKNNKEDAVHVVELIIDQLIKLTNGKVNITYALVENIADERGKTRFIIKDYS